MVLNQYFNFNVTVDVLAGAGGRALVQWSQNLETLGILVTQPSQNYFKQIFHQ